MDRGLTESSNLGLQSEINSPSMLIIALDLKNKV